MSQSPEVQSRIAILRQKAEHGEMTLEDMKDVVRLVRGDRRHALAASSASKVKKAKVAIPDADDLLAEM